MARQRTTRPKKKPTEASGQGLRPEVMDLLLGWQSDHGKSEPMGFGAPRAETTIEGEIPVVFAEDRHLLARSARAILHKGGGALSDLVDALCRKAAPLSRITGGGDQEVPA